MRQHGLVRGLERLDDLLVVLERVPGALGRVGDVVEVDLQLFLEVPLLGPLEIAEHGALGPHDLAEVDDLLLRLGELAHDLRRAALEDVVLEALELEAHLAQHRERRIDAGVDDLVQQVARALREDLLAQVVLLAVALEHRRQGRQRDVRERDQVVGAQEEVELGGQDAPRVLVEQREVQNDEDVVVVLVELRALVARVDVLVVERVEVEMLLEPVAIGAARRLDVDPAQPGRLDDVGRSDVQRQRRFRRTGGAARARSRERTRQGDVRHGAIVAART